MKSNHITALPHPTVASHCPYSESILTWTYSGPHPGTFLSTLPPCAPTFFTVLNVSGCSLAVSFALRAVPSGPLWSASKFQCLLQTQMGIFVSDFVVWFPLSHLDSCTHCCYHTTCHDVVTIRHVCCLIRPGLPQGESRLSCSPWHPVQSLALNRCPGNVVTSINYDVISVDKELELIS